MLHTRNHYIFKFLCVVSTKEGFVLLECQGIGIIVCHVSKISPLTCWRLTCQEEEEARHGHKCGLHSSKTVEDHFSTAKPQLPTEYSSTVILPRTSCSVQIKYSTVVCDLCPTTVVSTLSTALVSSGVKSDYTRALHHHHHQANSTDVHSVYHYP